MSKKKSKDGQIKTTEEGAVVMPPKMDKDAIYMAEEVDTLDQAKRTIKDDVKTKLNQLVGKTVKEVKSELEKFVADGIIGCFRILTQGQSYTGEFVPDRVQVSVGIDDQVKEVQVG